MKHDELLSMTESNTDVAFASAEVVPFRGVPTRLIVSEPAQQWRAAVIDRLEELVRLQQGWDGYSGEPVSLLNANFALRMLEAVCASDTPVPQIVPGSSGDLQVEWHTAHGDVELHVKGPNNVTAWRSNAHTGVEGEEVELTNNFIAVAHWVGELESIGAATAAA